MLCLFVMCTLLNSLLNCGSCISSQFYIILDRFSAVRADCTFKFIYLYHILSYVNCHLNFRIVVFI